MKTAFASFFLGVFVAVWLTPVARRLAMRLRLVDRPQDGRRVNQKSIPRAGGLAIAAGVLVPILGLAFYENMVSHAIYEDMTGVVVVFVGALAALCVGLADDLARPSAKVRLLALITIAIMTWLGGHRVNDAYIPGIGEVAFGAWSLPVTVLWIVGVVVAFNFVDGLDGLAAGIALISTATLFVYAAIDQNVLVMTWTGAMAGALLGFLVFNFNPASIFMGDAGSNFLGYLLAVVALQASRKGATAVSLFVPLCVLGLPILDVTLTMVRRTLLRQGLFTSERGHLHHRLLQLGLSHRRAVLVLYAVTAVFCLGAMALSLPWLYVQIIIAIVVSVAIIGLMFATGYIRPRDLLQMYHQGRANEVRQRRVEATCQELTQCLQATETSSIDLSRILADLVERSCVTAVQYRCEHRCELVAGDYDGTAKGTRLTAKSGRAGAASAVIFWKDRTTDPSPRESAALTKLFAEVQCSCNAHAMHPPRLALHAESIPNRKALGQMSVKAQVDKVWTAIVESADKLSLQRIHLQVDLPHLPEGFNATWETDIPREGGKTWRVDVPVRSVSGVAGYLRVTGESSRAATRQDIAGLLDILDTSESYLTSVLQEQGHMPIAAAAPHTVFGHDRSAASDLFDGFYGHEIEKEQPVEVSV